MAETWDYAELMAREKYPDLPPELFQTPQAADIGRTMLEEGNGAITEYGLIRGKDGQPLAGIPAWADTGNGDDVMDIRQKRDLLMSLPLMDRERQWIMDRLETLSVKEQYQLSAAILRTGRLGELAGKTGWELQTAILHMDPEVAVDAVNCLLSLEDYQVCFPAGSYAQLGSFYLRHEGYLPERAMYYTDLEALGRRYGGPAPRPVRRELLCGVPGTSPPPPATPPGAHPGGCRLEYEGEAGLFGGAGGCVAAPAGPFSRQ